MSVRPDYIRTWAGFAYLALVIDVFSRRILGWALAPHLRTRAATGSTRISHLDSLPTAPSGVRRHQPGRGPQDRAVDRRVVPQLPIPEIARLGRTLAAWRQQFLAYFTTARTSNGGTEAINGIIELHRRIARGFRNPANNRLRMILAAGKLTHSNLR